MKKIVLFGWIFILILSACGGQQHIPLTLTGKLVQASASAMPSPPTIILPTETPAVQQIATLPPATLSPTGPWLVYASGTGIHVMNQDGTGPFIIAPPPLPEFPAMTFDLPSGISKSCPYLALRSDSPDGHGWILEVIHFPDLKIVMTTPLLSKTNFPATMQMSDLSPDLVTAILDADALSWSPDGRYLAFVAALDNASSDLYVYDTAGNKTTRLSTGDLQVATPLWTLDSSKVIYQVVETFGSGAGWVSKSIYLVNVDGSGEKLIARLPEMVGPVRFIGVTQDNLILVDLFSQLDIPKLQVVNAAAGMLKPISIGDILSADIDPVTGAYAYIDMDGSLYYTGNPVKSPQKLDPGPWKFVSWSPIASEFFVIGENKVDLLFAVEDSAMLSPSFETGGTLTRSPDGNMLCLAGQTLRCESMKWKKDVMNFPGAVVLWAPDSSGIFFWALYDLYYAAAPDFLMTIVDHDIPFVRFKDKTLIPDGIGWIGSGK